MPLNDIIILIPSHSLEDFPSDQTEQPAAGLLNAFAVAWHPQLIATAGQIPRWHRADEPPELQPGQLFFAPEVCEGWLPHDFADRARDVGAVVVEHVHTRAEVETAALAAVTPQSLNRELVRDFYALGVHWILVELLTRHMRNFGNIDELRLQNRTLAAARAVLADDIPTAEAHLQAAFEVLQEARERFYPVDCYLLDLCLVTPDGVNDAFRHLLTGKHPVNVLLNGSELEKVALSIREKMAEPVATTNSAPNRESGESVTSGVPLAEREADFREGCFRDHVCLIGGELHDRPLPLLPLESVLWTFDRGRREFQRVTGRMPRVWGRRRFGLCPAVPQVLTKFGYVGALHVVLDDGIYPDAEHARMRWQGCDETVLDAFSRIPLAADSSSSYLRFPARMAESMDNDHVAGIAFARWPELSTPWLEDLQRGQKYGSVLGRFITFEQLFATSGSPGKLCANAAKEYFTANLIQHVARREADPISRYAAHTLRRRRFDAANWCRAVAAALMNQSVQSDEELSLEDALESAGPERVEGTELAAVDERLTAAEKAWSEQLATLLGGPKADAAVAGWLAINPYAFTRRVTLPLPQLDSPPPAGGFIKAVDWDATNADQRHVTLDLPGCGFVWMPANAAATPAPVVKRPPVEPWVLRNERFEVTLNDATGGIVQVRHPLRRENRFSQVLSYRFPRERNVTVEDEGVRRTVKTQYAAARCEGHEIQTGGAITAGVTWGVMFDQTNNETLARFRQTVRLYRLRPIVEIEVELTNVKVIDGDPWNNYFCSRFAWDDSAASLTRTQVDGAHGFMGERFESSEYIEIATANERATIVTHGLPFHRKTGARMLDTLLITAGETRRRFRFTIAIDQPYPLEAARDLTGPVYVVPTAQPPRLTTGWLFHLDARNVQLQRLLDVIKSPDDAEGNARSGPGFAVRLLETEGHARKVALRCFRAPLSARKRDFQGQTLRELVIEGDAVLVDMTAYEIAEVELRFA